jgi:4-hydroxy-4-methyl-2-oxoglutarate aldolase
MDGKEITRKALGRQSTATLSDVQGGLGIVEAPITPLFVPCRTAGPAFPVALPVGDNLSLHHALAHAPHGSVLAVTCGDTGHGFWGEITTVAALARGIAGLVTDGAIRDSDAIRRLNFPVFCGGIHIRGTAKRKLGSIDAPISLGGVMIRAGDFIVADSDGIVIVSADAMEKTLKLALEREEKERRIMLELQAGKTTIELLGLADLDDQCTL